MKCRYCKEQNLIEFLDLGQQSLGNDYVANDKFGQYYLPNKVCI